LVTLYDRRNRVQSRESLLDHVWASKRASRPAPSTPTSNASAKIGAARDYIETVRASAIVLRTPLVEAS